MKIEHFYEIFSVKLVLSFQCKEIGKNFFHIRNQHGRFSRNRYTYVQATGIGGGRGVFLVYPPLAENFSKIPPLEILGQAAILFFK